MATYQVWAAPINDTLAHFQAWAQFFGGGFTTLGWVAQSGHGEVVATGTGSGYAWTNPVVPPQVGMVGPSLYTFKGAWSSGGVFTGSNSAGTTNEVDLVTNSGITYQCIAPTQHATITSVSNVSGTTYAYNGTAFDFSIGDTVVISNTGANNLSAGNLGTFVVTGKTSTTAFTVTNASGVVETKNGTATEGTAPASDSVHWVPLQFEIWKSNGAISSTLPIYIRLTYACQGAGAGYLRMLMAIGTGIDSNGNITNPITLGGTPTNVATFDPGASSTSILGEMDMAGDADNVRFAFWRGPTSTANIAFMNIVVVDRSKLSTGADTDAFVYVGTILPASGTQAPRSSILLNPALGGGPVAYSPTNWAGVVSSGGATSSLAMFGSTPVFPIFPVIGYLANPLLGAVGVHHDDAAGADGSMLPVYMYGATHNFMILSQLTAAAAFIDVGVANHGMNVAILWE